MALRNLLSAGALWGIMKKRFCGGSTMKEKRVILAAALVLAAAAALFWNSWRTELPLRLRETETTVIENPETGWQLVCATRDLLGDVEQVLEDYALVRIPVDALGLSREDFIRRYSLTGYTDGKKVGTAWLCEVDVSLVPDESNRQRTLDGELVDDGRQYFYSINGRYYAMQTAGRYYVISKNQSSILQKLLE